MSDPHPPSIAPPPMRVVTKGWFTTREESRTVQQLLAEDAKRGEGTSPTQPKPMISPPPVPRVPPKPDFYTKLDRPIAEPPE